MLGGVRRKVHVLVVDLPQSDAIFLKAYLAETAEALCDGHVAAFDFFGGVPLSILYDNTKLAVAKILGDGTRTRATLFAELQSHYLFRTASVGPARVTTRAMWRGWWALAAGPSWSRSRRRPTSTR